MRPIFRRSKFDHLRSGEDATAFRTLNEEWITRYFTLEKMDRETLGDPESKILKKGGYIFMAYLGRSGRWLRRFDSYGQWGL